MNYQSPVSLAAASTAENMFKLILELQEIHLQGFQSTESTQGYVRSH